MKIRGSNRDDMAEVILNGDDAHNHQLPPSLLCSYRFLISIMLFLAGAIQYIQKINMGIAIVCMVNSTALRNNVSKDGFFGFQDQTNSTCMFRPDNGSIPKVKFR